MKFSLINVVESSGTRVSGTWVQNHVGTLDSAREVARATEVVNSNKIMVAVVLEVSSTAPALGFYANLPRLDIEL